MIRLSGEKGRSRKKVLVPYAWTSTLLPSPDRINRINTLQNGLALVSKGRNFATRIKKAQVPRVALCQGVSALPSTREKPDVEGHSVPSPTNVGIAISPTQLTSPICVANAHKVKIMPLQGQTIEGIQENSIKMENSLPTPTKMREDSATPIKTDVLRALLKNYPDKDYILSGFEVGFKIGFDGIESNVFCNNSNSAIINPAAVQEKLESELAMNRISGPYSSPPFKHFKCSPLSLLLKSNGKFRLLHNLSYPYNEHSVNKSIPESASKVKFSNIGHALDIIKVNRCCFLAKADIAEAFRLIPIHPSDYHLLGFKFQDEYYYDRCLPMGCSSACKIFERVSDALEFILINTYKVSHVVKYLDDFLFIANSEKECSKALSDFRDMCSVINFPIAEKKTEGPVTSLIFLGYHIDTIKMVVSIPKEKITKYSDEVKRIRAAKKATLRDIKSLIGKLQFVTNIISSGRCFLRRFINLTIGKLHPGQWLTIDEVTSDDLKIWEDFLLFYNGKSLIQLQPVIDSDRWHFFTDSSKIGYGGTLGASFIYGKFPDSWHHYNIQILELYPIYVMISMFAHDLANSSIVFHCDNEAIVQIINKQSSRDVQVMKLLRPMILVMLKYNITFKSVHIPGVHNILCDALSRSQVTSQLLRHHGMGRYPTPVPLWLRPHNLRI